MKGKIITGRGLSGLARYVNKADAEHIAGSCEPRDFLRTAAALRAQRPDVRQAAIHISISMPPGQPLTPAQWAAAGDILMHEMEMDGMEFQLVRHKDTEHDHCHLIACKVRADGSLWNDSHSARRLHRACEAIEIKLGLQHTITVEEHRQKRQVGAASKPMSDGALRAFQRTGTLPNKTKEAIARRIKHEREAADRAAHPAPGRDAGLMDKSLSGNPGANHQPRQPHRSAGNGAQQGFRPDSRPVTARRSAGGKADRPVQPTQVAPAAARPAAPVQKEDTMLEQLFKRKTDPQTARDLDLAQLKATIDEALPRCTTINDFDSALAARGIRSEEDSYFENESMSCRWVYSFGDDGGRKYSDHDLGKEYSRESLRRRMQQQRQQQVQGSIESSLPPVMTPTVNPSAPPTLQGRLMPVKLMNGHFDLFWKDRAEGKPSFRWQSAEQRLLILAQPTEKNVAALFDAAKEKGIGMPQIVISGTPEFQRLAAQEAARRGLPVDTSKLDETARELYRQTFDQQHGAAANSITAGAYESQAREEERRAAELAAAQEKLGKEDADDTSRDRQHMQMRG